MTINEEKVFVENPFDSLKIVIPTLLIMFIGAVLIISYNGPPKSPKSPFKTVEGFIVFFFCGEVLILFVVVIAMSFTKKRKIVCDSEGCQISGIDLWGNMAADENFRWQEVTDTNLTLTSIGKNGEQLNFTATIKDKETRLLSRTWFNKRDFDELILTFNQSTLHLPYICAKTATAGTRQIIEEKRNYCKIARR